MAEIRVILRDLVTSNEGDVYGLKFTASPREHLASYLMKISSYYSTTAGIRTSDLPHGMTTSRKV